MEEFKSITIVRIRRPKTKDLNHDLQWFSRSLGLFKSRDKEKSCFRVFMELLKENGLSSDEIAFSSNLTRGTVVHHLHSLIESGLVTKRKNKYYLITNNLENLIKELKKEVETTLDNLNETAKFLDKQLNLNKD